MSKAGSLIQLHSHTNLEILEFLSDVNDNLYLPNKKLTGFPGFKFRNVQGTCNFSGNRFTDFS